VGSRSVPARPAASSAAGGSGWGVVAAAGADVAGPFAGVFLAGAFFAGGFAAVALAAGAFFAGAFFAGAFFAAGGDVGAVGAGGAAAGAAASVGGGVGSDVVTRPATPLTTRLATVIGSLATEVIVERSFMAPLKPLPARTLATCAGERCVSLTTSSRPRRGSHASGHGAERVVLGQQLVDPRRAAPYAARTVWHGGGMDQTRTDTIIEVLGEAFAPLMEADPPAFRAKYRTMASDPHSFYRGTACLFYRDVVQDGDDDPFATGDAARIWVHGDLHVENFGTYLNSDGRLVFDVNDFDEAYLGRFTWDLMRFAASLHLVGWQKALPDEVVAGLVERYLRAYLDQVERYVATDDDTGEFELHLDNTEGPIRAALVTARRRRRADLLDGNTREVEGTRRFRDDDPSLRRLEDGERDAVVVAYDRYLETIPAHRRSDRALYYDLRDVAGKSGFGIGSAGLPAYNLLIEGHSQALDNDVLLSMKQANVPAISRYVDTSAVEAYFEHEGHRTAVSQRALQVHTDPLLGHTSVGGVGYVVSEVSPYEVDLDWTHLTEPDDIEQVVGLLGRATAKIHCASDEDSDQHLVDFQVESAITDAVAGREDELVAWLGEFGREYAARVREDHVTFVDAFREGLVGVDATA
jgi:uncharacterized protein (DUF2252 family)